LGKPAGREVWEGEGGGKLRGRDLMQGEIYTNPNCYQQRVTKRGREYEGIKLLKDKSPGLTEFGELLHGKKRKKGFAVDAKRGRRGSQLHAPVTRGSLCNL